MSSRPAWLHNETLSQTNKQRNKNHLAKFLSINLVSHIFAVNNFINRSMDNYLQI
jgi:hypothetical protein